MNITRENVDELNAVVKINIVKDDYAEAVEKSLKDYRKKAAIRGFRPGNAPMGMVKKLYGKSALLDELNRIVYRNLMEYIKTENLDILGEPLPSLSNPSDVDVDNKEEFSFNFDLGLKPKFELGLSKKMKINYYNIAVNDEMVNSMMESNSYRYGRSEEADVVAEKDLVKADFAQLDEAGNVVADGIKVEDTMFATDRVGASAQSLIIGAAKGASIDLDIEKAFENETDRSSMLRISGENKKATGMFRLTIKGITRHIMAEANQELFDKVYGEGVVKSLDEYKARIAEDFKAELALQSDFKFGIDAKAKMLEKCKIALPDAFLKRWVVAANDNITAEQVEKDYDNMAKEFSWQLIKTQVAEENKLTVAEEDLLAEAKEALSAQFRQYGFASLPDEQLTEFAKSQLNKEEDRRNFAERSMEKKVLAVIKDAVKIEEKEVSTQEFNELFK